MFASTYILASGHSSQHSAGFFYARTDHKKRFCTPVYSCNGYTICSSNVSQRERQNRHFFLPQQIFNSVMTYAEKQGLSGNNSTCKPTRAPRKRVSIHKFLTEKNAKNSAYAFILACGLLDEFARFTRSTHGLDCHALTITLLDEDGDGKQEKHANQKRMP